MKINIKETLKFFDQRQNSRGHASAIAGVVGEDLNAFVFKHYMEFELKAKTVKIFAGPVKQGTKKGKWLDRWIYVEERDGTKILYQCEIKSWSAAAFGGQDLLEKEGLESDDTKKVALNHWEKQKKLFSKDKEPNLVTKTLVRMDPNRNKEVKEFLKERRINKKDYKQKPLLLYWMPISNEEDRTPFFSEKVLKLKINFKSNFKEKLYIFSVSLYLRKLGKKKFLPLNMPNVKKRIDILNKIVVS
ncbi:MAG: hypothetical protein A2571_01955 [Candidatus Vogelbacteria bacterium RIFOXYD1_FULL_44_32]|uniref:Uncharacterized protein n=1 Tax=Candidatus Vogelbacteria bacterium RIFOXYD1_FULL_44_32 TaxID=1802438 RepID=A0A1G2QDJ8_9BACT|nr:MAG: hypothetical protein A2571_01955 [Candidatus Vogelbacteria bacterium RIFOXYD1_FULL_44_32]